MERSPGPLPAPALECAEEQRLAEATSGAQAWRLWGPYLSERQWSTVREDYSPDGDAWAYLPHDHARSRAYRWGEDGIAGISDDRQILCFALALWNGRDPILKERLFGLTNREGNHGEDVKELYWHLDATPTASFLAYRYRYPHGAFPYAGLVAEAARRTRQDREYELCDTGIFADSRFFDVTVTYAKDGPTDLHVLIEVANAGPEVAELHLLPQLWFRNTWSWRAGRPRPRLGPAGGGRAVRAEHATLGTYHLSALGEPSSSSATTTPTCVACTASTRRVRSRTASTPP